MTRKLEVAGHQFEGARLNYEGNRALGWQTLWLGPWLLDGILDGAGDVSEHLPESFCRRTTAPARQRSSQHATLYADSGSSAGKYLNQIEQGRLCPLECQLQQVDRQAGPAGGGVAGESMECKGRLPQSTSRTICLAQASRRGVPGRAEVCHPLRWKKEGDLMWRYAYVVCQPGEKDSPSWGF